MHNQRQVHPKTQNAFDQLFFRCAEPVILLSYQARPTTRFESKLGGEPYFAYGDEYPMSADGTPLHLFCQLNFAELPPLPSFPKRGLLQIFSSDNYQSMFWQSNFQIIFHSTIDMNEDMQADIPEFDEPPTFPFRNEIHLAGKYGEEIMRYESRYVERQIKDLFGDNPYPSRGLHSFRQFSTPLGPRIGGYPDFIHFDPRNHSISPEYSTVLLELESMNGVHIGDNGVAQFLIKPQDLRTRNFTNVTGTMQGH